MQCSLGQWKTPRGWSMWDVAQRSCAISKSNELILLGLFPKLSCLCVYSWRERVSGVMFINNINFYSCSWCLQVGGFTTKSVPPASFLLPAPDQHPVLDAFYKYKIHCNCVDKTGRRKNNNRSWGRESKKDNRLYSLGKFRIIAEIKMTEEGAGTKNST